jgi:hypothetical protein
MKFNELPKELLLEISRYLSLFDIGFSLIGVCNRLDTFLAKNISWCRTLKFTIGSCSYSDYQAFLHNYNGFRTRLNIFLRSITLDGLYASHMVAQILLRWADDPTSSFLPFVRELTLSNTFYKDFHVAYQRSLATVLACGPGTNIIEQLEKLTLSFRNATNQYISVLHELIFLQASCHTMIMNITDGKYQ